MSETATKPITEMTSQELEAFLAQKKKAEKAEQRRKEREYEAEKNAFVEEAVKKAQSFHNSLTNFKQYLLGEGNALHQQMYQVYNKEPKSLKTFTLQNEAGTMKLELQSADKQGFDETAEVAIKQIKDILEKKFSARNKAMYQIIDDILSTNAAGDYDPKLVNRLRKHEDKVDDPAFSEALDILGNSYKVEGTAMYCRFYVRTSPEQPWKLISLQFSAL
jgi:hypothetical protein